LVKKTGKAVGIFYKAKFPGEGYAEVWRWLISISAAGLQGEEPLVDRL
jgi:hypothetical protein